MALVDEPIKLTKKQRKQQQFSELYGCNKKYSSNTTQMINRQIFIDDSVSEPESDLTNLFVNFSAKVPFTRACCHCSKSSQRQMKYRCWELRLSVARYATTVLMSMLFLFASAQDVNIQQVSRATSNSLSSEAKAHALNETSSLSSSSQSIFTNVNFTQTKSELELESESEPENATTNPTFSNQNEVEGRQNKESEILSGLSPGIQVVSINRNSLISGDNVLQRQLREKAKQDSLESIKMHILLRLNLKKLPNITKPISVPQNILENFYKNYNASLLKSTWHHDSTAPRTGLYVSDEIMTQSTKTSLNATKNIQRNRNSEYASDDLSNENSSTDMQGDDPNAYDEFQFVYNIGLDEQQKLANHRPSDYSINDNDDDGEYESILSHISSIYIFPEQPHVRHSRKPDVLRFRLATSYSDVSYVTLHLYLRGLDWISAHQPNIIEEIADYQNKDIVVAVHRAVRRPNSTYYTHKAKMFEFRHKIPSGLGQWVNVDLKPLFGTGTTMVSHGPNKTQDIFIKGVESWMKPLVVTTDSATKNPLTVHIEIGSRKKHRRKRSIFLDCTESDHDMGCCRYPLKVNFTSFGWHFVVAPTSFDAYFCSGDCRVGYLEQYPHTHLAALTTSATPCCSPTKMSSLSLLYFDDNHNLVLSVIPNMSVEGCSCS